MPFIIMVILIVYLIAIGWTWKTLGEIERNKKIMIIAIGILIMLVITLIVFGISKNGISYENKMIENNIRNIIVALFTGLNSIIVLPFVGRTLEKVEEDEIEKKDFQKRLIIFIVVFITILIFESGYMKDTQEGILKIYQAMK